MIPADHVVVPVCDISSIPPGMGRAFQIGSHRVAVFLTREGRVYATEQRCPHRGGPLADGMLVGKQVVCPLHSFRFDLETGQCEQPGVCPVRLYPVEVTPDGQILIGVPRSTASGPAVSPVLSGC